MNILAVGAHYDDIELGCSGTLKKLKDKGHRIIYYVGTTSGFNALLDLKQVRSAENAQKEGELAAQKMGAILYSGNALTFELNYNNELNTELAGIIEKEKIDILFNQWGDEYHHDHWSLSKAAYHASKHVKRVLEYHSNWYEARTQFCANFFVDISDYIDFKLQLLKVYESEYRRVGDDWEKFVINTSRIYGLKNGCEYAEGFKCIRWLD